MFGSRQLIIVIISLVLPFFLLTSETLANWQMPFLKGGSIDLADSSKNEQIGKTRSSLRKGTSGTILVVGDSIGLQTYTNTKLCSSDRNRTYIDYAITTGSPSLRYSAGSPSQQYFGQLYESVYISDWEHAVHMCNDVIPTPSSLLRRFDAVFLNFAVLHTFIRPERKGNITFPQLATNIYFERIMEKEIDSYLRVASLVFVQSPPKVCESKYIGAYKDVIDHFEEFLHNGTKSLQSKYEDALNKSTMPWIFAESATMNYAIPLRHFDLSDYTTAYQFTKNHTLTGYGSVYYRDRMKEAVSAYKHARPNVSDRVHFFDLFELNEEVDCWTSDGRHYNKTFNVQYVAPSLCSRLLSLIRS